MGYKDNVEYHLLCLW